MGKSKGLIVILKNRAIQVLVCGTLILALSIGIRLTFGLFLQPMSEANGWGRETFAFAIAMQNLIWGLAQPFVGALADKRGAGKVVAVGGVGYGLGLYLMSQSQTTLALNLSAGLLVGLGLSATSFAVVLGAVGRAIDPKRRSMALGVASSGGSLGQFLMLPIGQAMIDSWGWIMALAGLGLWAGLMLPLAAAMAGKSSGAEGNLPPQPIGQALSEAAGNRGFWLLTAGFFVCGFQVTFIGTHLPAFLVDNGFSPTLGAIALAVVGFFNIIGSNFWGWMGGLYSKKNNLSLLYMARSLVIAALLAFPLSKVSVLIFAGAMGFLWLGTVPLTSGLVGTIFGVQYLSTLFGIVFLGHQVGAFLGIWLGGYFFDQTGSYDMIWYASIALGFVSALLHWPIKEEPVAQLATGEN